MIVAGLILNFDFKYPEGKARPRNVRVDEWIFPEIGATLMVRQRVANPNLPVLAMEGSIED